MPAINRIADFHAEMAEWRHRIPTLTPKPLSRNTRCAESGLAEIPAILWGIGVDRGGCPNRRNRHTAGGSIARPPAIGLRADMDALPTSENEPASAMTRSTQGKMHACGHDGHTVMLLGAAKYLAETKTSTAPSTSSSSRPRRTRAAAG